MTTRNRKLAGVLAIASLLGACTSQPAAVTPMANVRVYVPSTRAACLAAQGRWAWPGILHRKETDEYQGTCVTAARDARHACRTYRSSSDCTGLCLATADSANTHSGESASSNFAVGYRSMVDNGESSPAVCVD